jgi:cytoskeletal protein RodZ
MIKLTKYIKGVRVKSKEMLFLLLIVGALIVGGYFLYNSTNTPAPTTSIPSTTQNEDIKNVEQGVSAKNSNSTTSSSMSDKQGGSTASPQTSLDTPTGNFVSSHKVSSSTNTLESICTTTTGATCEITFRKGDTILTLGKKDVNNSGTATWIWTPGSIALTNGSWEITATATLGDKTSTAIDPLKLDVSL